MNEITPDWEKLYYAQVDATDEISAKYRAGVRRIAKLEKELAAAKAALYDQTEGITAEMDYQAAKEKHYEECAVMCERQGEHFGPWFGDLIRSSLPALTDYGGI